MQPIYKKLLALAVGLPLFITFPFLISAQNNRSNILTVSVLDVGQGDSMLIETPNGKKILVDGGPNDAVLASLSGRMSFFNRSFELIILTHPDRDHMDGLIPLLDRYAVKKILISGAWKKNAFTETLLEKIISKKIPLSFADENNDFTIDEVEFDILFPPHILLGEKIDVNEGSVVFMMKFGKTNMLFTGDAEKNTEEWLVKNSVALKADVLKVGHHGSKTSSSREFLAKVRPVLAVISVGKKNKFNHPSDITLENLRKIGAKILRTDEEGTIVLHFESPDTVDSRSDTAKFFVKFFVSAVNVMDI